MIVVQNEVTWNRTLQSHARCGFTAEPLCVDSPAQLEGVSEPVVLQVFVGNDTGRVKPHGFYQACRVTGRNTTACKEVDIEGTTVIEVPLEPSASMTLAYVPFLHVCIPTIWLPYGPESLSRLSDGSSVLNVLSRQTIPFILYGSASWKVLSKPMVV